MRGAAATRGAVLLRARCLMMLCVALRRALPAAAARCPMFMSLFYARRHRPSRSSPIIIPLFFIIDYFFFFIFFERVLLICDIDYDRNAICCVALCCCAAER